jgi:hypothetical protein
MCLGRISADYFCHQVHSIGILGESLATNLHPHVCVALARALFRGWWIYG